MRGIRPALAPAAAVRRCSSPVAAATPLSDAPSKDAATLRTGSSGSFTAVSSERAAMHMLSSCSLAATWQALRF